MKTKESFIKKKFKPLKRIYRRGKIYGWNIVGIVLIATFLTLIFFKTGKINAEYEQHVVEKPQEDPETLHNVDYYYYLDFSPSMLGFFNESVNSEMGIFAETLEAIDGFVNSRSYYRCTDIVEDISDTVFFSNMKQMKDYTEYYDGIIKGTQGNQDIITRTENMDLKNIFSGTYEDGRKYAQQKDSIKIIITDLAFKQTQQGATQESVDILDSFIKELIKNNVDSNIGIYQIVSDFLGSNEDQYIVQANLTQKEKAFYIVVLSENKTVYSDFTKNLEEKMTEAGVDCSEKYELLNQVVDSDFKLVIGNTKEMFINEYLKKENLNFDNESFQSLKENEIALRVVQKEQKESIFLDISIPLEIKGNELQTDAMKITAKYTSYTEKGEKYEGDDIVQMLSAGTEWKSEENYLRTVLELDAVALDKAFEKKKFFNTNIIGRNYYVVELQFFIEEPSFVTPKWFSMSEEDVVDDDTNIQSIVSAFLEIGNAKKERYAKLSEAERYLGNIVVYLTY